MIQSEVENGHISNITGRERFKNDREREGGREIHILESTITGVREI